MSIETIIGDLNENQQAAVKADFNAVVSSGAGSGKTKTLASRFIYLIMQQGIHVDEILALTFTNKAAGEMIDRIYNMLLKEKDNPAAAKAVEDFQKASIKTIDAFCTGIAKIAARRYGINPLFTIDNKQIEKIAADDALPFLLNNINNPAVQALMGKSKLKVIANEIFVNVVIEYSSITRPMTAKTLLDKQKSELLRLWKKQTESSTQIISDIRGELQNIDDKGSENFNFVLDIFSKDFTIPQIDILLDNNKAGKQNSAAALESFCKSFSDIKEIKLPKLSGNLKSLKSFVKTLRDDDLPQIYNLANLALQWDAVGDILSLIEEFQTSFNIKKRENGVLSFKDAAELAVDALRDHPDIRMSYKKMYKSIMIDEFQDNNSLQKDLLFLLAEKLSGSSQGIPSAGELENNKLFFVGDEKQSIYKFRGADVAVFRNLSELLSGENNNEKCELHLHTNYRSGRSLINAFNYIFNIVFPFQSTGGPYEAHSSDMLCPDALLQKEETTPPAAHFCFLDTGISDTADVDISEEKLPVHDIQAIYIVNKIIALVNEGYLVTDKKTNNDLRSCRYSDFAILQRKTTHQWRLEKYLRQFNIPYECENLNSLFGDAPVNDIFCFLKLLVYPYDKLSYAVVLRSPFCRLNDETFSVCMMSDEIAFSEKIDAQLSGKERTRFAEAREQYKKLQRLSTELSCAELITYLWYTEGYRFQTVWNTNAQIYGALYDSFFEIARLSDSGGDSLVDFIDTAWAYKQEKEKLEFKNMPFENRDGVKIMTIHKSKGLEFPVVFLFDGNAKGPAAMNRELLFYDEQYGISINFPPASNIPGKAENIFFNIQKENEKLKDAAELKRLLYVAMTRAMSAFYFIAALPKPTNDELKECPDLETEDYNEAHIQNRLNIIANIKETKTGTNFFDLLLPVLASNCTELEDKPFNIETIPRLYRSDIKRLLPKSNIKTNYETISNAAVNAIPFYDNAVALPHNIKISTINASSLHIAGDIANDVNIQSTGTELWPELDAVLADNKNALNAKNFGTLVHGLIEMKIAEINKPAYRKDDLLKTINKCKGIQNILNEREAKVILESAELMVKMFFSSYPGVLLTESIENNSTALSEYGIITKQKIQYNDIIINGTLDLLFENNNTMYIVDYKTDYMENADKHAAQLAVYSQAISEIFNKPVKAYIYFLRTSHFIDMSEKIKALDWNVFESDMEE